MTETKELAVITAQNAVQIFTGGGLNAVLDEIEAKVRAIPLDPSTAVGREEIRSVAYQIARTKTALDAEGKKLTEGWREATTKVNAERKKSAERLEALQEEIRKPLTDFENKEKIRVAAHEEALADITGLHAMLAANPEMSLSVLGDHGRDLVGLHIGRNWEEFSQRAASARAEAEKYVLARIESRKRWEDEQAELARLRKEEAERKQREHEQRLKEEAAEKARLEAERIAKEERDAEAKRVIEAAERERKRVAEEAERVRIENERQRREIEAARRKEEEAKLAAEKRAKDAEIAKLAAERKAADDLKAAREKAKRDQEAALAKERERVERERKEAESARLKREADDANRLRIRAEILEDLNKATTPVDAIMDGRVRHVRVIY
jgi:colicin import membrane protein